MSRLNNKEYRHSYVNGFQDGRLAMQILAMREKAGLSQEALAHALGTKQSRISQLEKGNYEGWSVRMLRTVAAFFDVAVAVKFDSFRNVLADLKSGNADNLVPAPYESVSPTVRVADTLEAPRHVDVRTFPGGAKVSVNYFLSQDLSASRESAINAPLVGELIATRKESIAA